MDPQPSRKAKDHVFVDMFNRPKYCLELYRALHPEDTDVTEADIQNITLSHVIIDRPYNDLGFIVRDKLLVLVEAQSTWSYNILVRLLFYFVDTMEGYIKERKNQDLHKTKTMYLPIPEFYVIYTGERRTVPDWISLRKDFFHDLNAPIDLMARVISAENTNDIIGQYIIYAHILDKQLKRHGRTRKAVQETIRICSDRNVLREYLKAHEREVLTVMISLFDQEVAMKKYGDRRVVEAFAKLVSKGCLSLEEAANELDMPVKDLEQEVRDYEEGNFEEDGVV